MVLALSLWSRVRVPQGPVFGLKQNDPVVDCAHQDSKTMMVLARVFESHNVQFVDQTKTIHVLIVNIRALKLCAEFTTNLSGSPEFHLSRYMSIF